MSLETKILIEIRAVSCLLLTLALFSQALRNRPHPGRVLELGANIGMNLHALRQLSPKSEFWGIEINQQAHAQLEKLIGADKAVHSSIFDFEAPESFDMVLIKTVLIHINPDELKRVYEKMYQFSSRYILICEYYNPSPVEVTYRGHTARLFKRDFAGEMLDMYSDLELADYGFFYHRDRAYPQDDISWFLLEKKS